MRSVFARILLWCFGTLIIALVGFSLMAVISWQRGEGLGGSFERINQSAFHEARSAYESGGRVKLAETLAYLKPLMGRDFILADAKGADLVTGASYTDLLRNPRFPFPHRYQGRLVLTRVSPDGKYGFIIFIKDDESVANYLPFWLFLLATLALLCWALSVSIANPIRRLTTAVERFGSGDLNARVNSCRKDEIGKLSQAFDRMAERIATLVTAERRLLQDISHELRSPLSRLSFAAELVASSKDPIAATTRLKKEVRRLTSLVSALVEVTRAEGDPEARDSEPLDLSEILAEVVEDCRIDAEARECRIFLNCPSAHLLGDGELLRRAFENVIRNAVHYSPTGSHVEVKADLSGGMARLWVRDFGPGVPDDDLARIFQPFYRVDGSREAATGGVGLGLAIAARAIALHNGNIWARNAEPGLIVWIELPLTRA